MPNWCSNTLTITHENTAMIVRAKAAFANGGDPVAFPDHLNKLGMKVEGLGLAVDDALVSFIELKYGNTK